MSELARIGLAALDGPGSEYQLWRRRELLLLKTVWREASAFLVEPDDPSLRDGLRAAATAYHDWRREGLARGWQA